MVSVFGWSRTVRVPGLIKGGKCEQQDAVPRSATPTACCSSTRLRAAEVEPGCQQAKSGDQVASKALGMSQSWGIGASPQQRSKGTKAGIGQAQPTCAGFWLIRPFIWDRMSYSCLRLMPARVEVMGSGAPPGPAGAAPPTSPDTACAALAAVPTPTGCTAQAPVRTQAALHNPRSDAAHAVGNHGCSSSGVCQLQGEQGDRSNVWCRTLRIAITAARIVPHCAWVVVGRMDLHTLACTRQRAGLHMRRRQTE